MDSKIVQILQYPFSDNIRIFYKKFIFIAVLTFGAILLNYHTPLIDIFKYIGFQIIYVFLPGCFLYRLFRLDLDTSLFLVWAYALGVAFIITQFIICASIKYLPVLYYIGPILAAIEIFLIKRKQEKILTLSLFKQLPIQIWFIYSILLIITGFGLTLANPQPELLSYVSYGQDTIWNIGNAEALLNSFLPYDIRISGVVFKYHFFGAIYWAVIHYITNIDLFSVAYKFYAIGNLFLIVGSVYTLGMIVLKNIKQSLLFVWTYFFTACASLSTTLQNGYGVFLNLNFLHLTNNPFGYELSFPMYLFAVVLCIFQIKRTSIDIRYLFLTCLFVFICTGAKVPSGFLIFGSLIIVGIFAKIFQKDNKFLFAGSLFLAITSISVYFIFIKAAGGTNGLSFSPGLTVQHTIIGEYIAKFTRDEHTLMLLDNLLIPFHFWCFLPFASIPFICWIITRLKEVKSRSLVEIFVGSLALSGVVLTYLLSQIGNSHVYFIMFAIPFIDLIATLWIVENYSRIPIYTRHLLISMFIIATISAFFSAIHDFKMGVKKAVAVYKEAAVSSEGTSDWNGMTKYEFEAMQWLRKNSSFSSIIASDRWYYDSSQTSSRYFYYSTFSGRQFFLEGWDYTNQYTRDIVVPQKLAIVKKLYSMDPINRVEIMKRSNIDYLIVSRFVHPNSDFIDENLEKVFENKDVKIYRCKRNY